MGKLLINKRYRILLLLFMALGCKTNQYIHKSFEGVSYLMLYSDGNFTEKNVGFGTEGKEIIYGKWHKINDTIYLSYVKPQTYYTFDSLASIHEKYIKNLKGKCFKVHFPDTMFGFTVRVNGKEYISQEDSLCIPVKSINSFEICGFQTTTSYKVKNSLSNYFVINFKKNNYYDPILFLIDPPFKFIKRGRKLIPLDPYSSHPLNYYYIGSKKKFKANKKN